MNPTVRCRLLNAACLATIVAVGLAPSQAGTPSSIGLDDYGKIVNISDPQLSPDGTKIAFVVTRTDMTSDAFVSAIALTVVATGATRVLTQGRDRVRAPRWSPDGTRLSFITTPTCDVQPCNVRPQVFAFPMNGGDAIQLTNAANGVESYAWRPDGRAIAFITPDDPANKAEIQEHHDLFTVGDQDYLSQSAPVASQIWVQARNGGAVRITSGPTSVDGDADFASDPSWSADGTRIAYSRFPNAYTGRLTHLHACVIDVALKRVSCLTGSDHFSYDPVFAPEGNALLYSTAHDGSWSISEDAHVSDESQSWQVARDLDRDVQWDAWEPNGQGVWLAANDRATVGLWYASLHGAAHRIHLGDVVLSYGGYAIEGSVGRDGALAFVGSSPGDPSEIYYLASGLSAPRRLTNVNAWLADRAVARTREFTWTNESFSEDGVVTYPANYDPARRYPLVVMIHGGPTEASSLLGWNFLAQVFAAHGYFVLQPNYRGSDNLGFAYAKAIVGDIDAGPGRDIVAGVKALEASAPINPSRIGVSGYSGGGLLTSWLIGHYHIWRAAVSGAAADNLIEEYDLSDIFDYMPSLMGGLTPWRDDGRAKYLEASPVTYVANVTTPTLILSDTGDFRVPTVQAYEFYHALKEHGKVVKFVATPAHNHSPADAGLPVQELDMFKCWVGWMDHYLR